MMRSAKRLLAGYPHALRLARVVRHPLLYGLGYLYGAYLTVRHVDQYDRFPAIIFPSGLIRLRITKGAGSSLTIRGRLTVAPWQGGRAGSQIALDGDAKVVIDGDFGIGDDIRIGVGEGAQLLIGGKRERSEEHTSELQSRQYLVCRLLLEKKKTKLVTVSCSRMYNKMMEKM